MQLHRPMPRSLPRDSASARRAGKLSSSDSLGGLQHVAFELAAIIGEGQRGFVWHRVGRNQVAAAQFVRRDAQFARGDIDDALDRVGGFRTPGAAIRRGGHGVGDDAAGFRVHRRDVIHARRAADVADRPAGTAGDVARRDSTSQRSFSAVNLWSASRPSSTVMRISRACSSVRKASVRSSIQRTGRRSLRVAQQTSAYSACTPDFMPNEPPTSAASTRISVFATLKLPLAMPLRRWIRRLMRRVYFHAPIRAKFRPRAARLHRRWQ